MPAWPLITSQGLGQGQASHLSWLPSYSWSPSIFASNCRFFSFAHINLNLENSLFTITHKATQSGGDLRWGRGGPESVTILRCPSAITDYGTHLCPSSPFCYLVRSLPSFSGHTYCLWLQIQIKQWQVMRCQPGFQPWSPLKSSTPNSLLCVQRLLSSVHTVISV